MTAVKIRQKYLEFFKSKGHQEIPPAKLVLEDDPTTLFTSSGMQPLVPYLLGKEHPEGKRLVNSQPCFRAEDIEEVGDNRHTTFLEMLGNWSFGDYFKEDQLSWVWEFLTQELKLDPNKLYVSVFEGNEFVPKDMETLKIWKELGVAEDHIYFYGVEKNWWSKSGTPDKMPIGEIGGPDSEIFYEFTQVSHDKKYGEKCHPNCDCGRFFEIGNSVFIEYKKIGDNEFEKLPQHNVDFGGGLERLTAVTLNTPDVSQTDLFLPIIEQICKGLGISYEQYKQPIQIIADHIKASVFLIKDGVTPNNKMQGYVLRRLLRRAATKAFSIDKQKSDSKFFKSLTKTVMDIYPMYFEEVPLEDVEQEISLEIRKFRNTLEKGLKVIEKMQNVDGKAAFDLYQSYGFPSELTEELLRAKGLTFDRKQFEEEFEKHRELSRTASAGIFKGGLAGHSEIEIKYHTATHLLHQSLRDVLGPEVFQKGSNINQERLRFDFSFDRKVTDEELKKVEEIVNQKIKEDLVVENMMVSLDEAKEKGAIGLFDEKYGKDVSLYGVGPGYKLDPEAKDQRERAGFYSLEFCGGPHVSHTGEIGGIRITKEEAVSSGVRRIRAELVPS